MHNNAEVLHMKRKFNFKAAVIISVLCAAAVVPAAILKNAEAFRIQEDIGGPYEYVRHIDEGLTFSPETDFPAEAPDLLYSSMQTVTYTVKPGDSMWKIAQKYEIGLSELLKANPQIKNAASIYVGQKITIPEDSPLKALENEVVRLVNAERAKAGLGALKNNWQAARVARIKSQDMIDNNYFSHTSPVYGSPFKMMEKYGLKFSSAAENIAYGQRTAQEVMNSWMKSAGHKANILSKNVTEIGCGAAKKSNGTMYWTQMFLKPL